MISKEEILQALSDVKDPELGCNIVELGLIYDVFIDNNDLRIIYTLTSPTCPLGGIIEKNIRDRLRLTPNIGTITTELSFEPLWNQDRMSDELKKEFGMIGL